MERRESAARVRQRGSPGASDQSRMGLLYGQNGGRSKGIIWSSGLPVSYSAVKDHGQEDNELEDEETTHGWTLF